MRRSTRVGLLSLHACMTVSGCATTTSPTAAQTRTPAGQPTDASIGRVAELNRGYAILLDLLKDEARVSQVLAIKNASPGVRSLLKRISATASTNRISVEKLLDQAPALAPTGLGLPSIEVDARNRIDSRKRATTTVEKRRPPGGSMGGAYCGGYKGGEESVSSALRADV